MEASDLLARTVVADVWPAHLEKPCRLWLGALRKGYPAIKKDGRTVAGHRLMLELSQGRRLRPRVLACHHCDEPACIEPTHLYAGDNSTNAVDAFSRGRRSGETTRGVRNGKALLTEAGARDIKASRLPSHVLAGLYGVAPSTVRSIRTGARWAWLT